MSKTRMVVKAERRMLSGNSSEKRVYNRAPLAEK